MPVFKGFCKQNLGGDMKRFWLLLLSVGLIMAFSASADALDVKFSGEFYAAGMYLDKTTLTKGTASDGPSTAFYFQRLRVQTDFIITPGLMLITRFDAMERAWGASRSTPSSTQDIINGYFPVSAGTTAENENIAFDYLYLLYHSPIGSFDIGTQRNGFWGTVFGDSSIPAQNFGWFIQTGPWFAMAQIVKALDYSKTAKNPAVTTTDQDLDKYVAAALYMWKGGEVGALYFYAREAQLRNSPVIPLRGITYLHGFMPHAKFQIGPVKVETELNYYWGDSKGEDGNPNTKLESINFYLDAVADLGMFYVGGTFAYLSGDDPGTSDKIEGGSILNYAGTTGGGIDWNPCLIMFNFDRTYWVGPLSGYGDSNYSPMNNAWFGQFRGGIRPVAALDIMASVSYAVADQKPDALWLNKTYGTEVDLTATYKITNNLSYMLGIGYWFVGDYYKGYSTTNELRDDYLIINKLTLTF
jgi:hypothetical protein